MKTNFKFTMAAVAMVALTACGGGSDGGGSGGGDSADVPLSQAPALVQNFAGKFNEVRAIARACGSDQVPAVAPLTNWNPKLQQAAQQHANDMASKNFFSHIGSDGSTTYDRMTANGYDSVSGGEILARGSSNIDTLTKTWLASPGHCGSLMGGEFSTFAVAQNGAYTVAMFGD